MSYRVGHKVGKGYASFGKSGTYISTTLGGFRISKFSRNKTNHIKDEDISGWSEPDEVTAWIKHVLLIIIMVVSLLYAVHITGLILVPLGVMFVLHNVMSWLIWKNVNVDEKWINYIFPFIAVLNPVGFLCWVVIFIVAKILA